MRCLFTISLFWYISIFIDQFVYKPFGTTVTPVAPVDNYINFNLFRNSTLENMLHKHEGTQVDSY